MPRKRKVDVESVVFDEDEEGKAAEPTELTGGQIPMPETAMPTKAGDFGLERVFGRFVCKNNAALPVLPDGLLKDEEFFLDNHGIIYPFPVAANPSHIDKRYHDAWIRVYIIPWSNVAHIQPAQLSTYKGVGGPI